MSMVKSENMRLPWLLAALILSALLATLHWWALSDFLYWHYMWFDIPMHYLGGAVSAVFVFGFLLHKRVYVSVALLVLIFIGWEVFEFVFGLPVEANYPLDTAIDLVMDTLGALTVYAVARKTLWRA